MTNLDPGETIETRSNPKSAYRFHRRRIRSLGAAFVWSGVLIVGIFTFRLQLSGGSTAQTTLFRDDPASAVNIIVALCAPLLLAALNLLLSLKYGKNSLRPLTLVAVGLLALFSLFGLLWGILALWPVAGLLAYSARPISSRRPVRQPTPSS